MFLLRDKVLYILSNPAGRKIFEISGTFQHKDVHVKGFIYRFRDTFLLTMLYFNMQGCRCQVVSRTAAKQRLVSVRKDLFFFLLLIWSMFEIQRNSNRRRRIKHGDKKNMKGDILAVSTTEKQYNPSGGTIGQCFLVDFVTRCHFTSFKIEFVLITDTQLTVSRLSG